MVNNGFVHIHETAPWLGGDLHEMIVSRPASTTTRSIQRRSSSLGSSAVPGPIAVRAHEMDTQELRRRLAAPPNPVLLHSMARGTGKSAFFPTYNKRVLSINALRPSVKSRPRSRWPVGMRETPVAAQTDELHAMIAALAGSQALLLDVLRRRGSIVQDDIDYILAVTEQGIAKAVGTAGPQAVVQMIRLCLQQLSTSE